MGILQHQTGLVLTNEAAVGCFRKVAFFVEKSKKTKRFGKQQVENTAIVCILDVRHVDAFLAVFFLTDETTLHSTLSIMGWPVGRTYYISNGAR